MDEQIEEEDQVLQLDQDEEDGGGADEEKGDGEDGVADIYIMMKCLFVCL